MEHISAAFPLETALQASLDLEIASGDGLARTFAAFAFADCMRAFMACHSGVSRYVRARSSSSFLDCACSLSQNPPADLDILRVWRVARRKSSGPSLVWQLFRVRHLTGSCLSFKLIFMKQPTKRKPRRRARISKFPVRIGGIRLTVDCKEWLDAYCDEHEVSETDVVRESLDEFRKART